MRTERKVHKEVQGTGKKGAMQCSSGGGSERVARPAPGGRSLRGAPPCRELRKGTGWSQSTGRAAEQRTSAHTLAHAGTLLRLHSPKHGQRAAEIVSSAVACATAVVVWWRGDAVQCVWLHGVYLLVWFSR